MYAAHFKIIWLDLRDVSGETAALNFISKLSFQNFRVWWRNMGFGSLTLNFYTMEELKASRWIFEARGSNSADPHTLRTWMRISHRRKRRNIWHCRGRGPSVRGARHILSLTICIEAVQNMIVEVVSGAEHRDDFQVLVPTFLVAKRLTVYPSCNVCYFIIVMNMVTCTIITPLANNIVLLSIAIDPSLPNYRIRGFLYRFSGGRK